MQPWWTKDNINICNFSFSHYFWFPITYIFPRTYYFKLTILLLKFFQLLAIPIYVLKIVFGEDIILLFALWQYCFLLCHKQVLGAGVDVLFIFFWRITFYPVDKCGTAPWWWKRGIRQLCKVPHMLIFQTFHVWRLLVTGNVNIYNVSAAT